jgi:hypothetical protein
MKEESTAMKIFACLPLAALVLVITCYAQTGQQLWPIHSEQRDRPPVVTPPQQLGQPPADAIILFDGKDTSKWVSDKGGSIKWKVEDGYMQVVKKAGSIRTLEEFGNCQLHIEWWTPPGLGPKATGQERSNSGVFFMGRYELQVLDSYTEDNYKDNRTYADGQAASLYGQYPPLVNACRKPGQWQSYDVSFLRPLFDAGGKCIRPARITVFHNGVVVHNNVDIQGATAHKQKAKYSPHGKGPLSLQDHGAPVRYRNIWIREMPEQPYTVAD